jgi:hypothetical protein
MQGTILYIGLTGLILFFLGYIITTVSNNHTRRSLIRDGGNAEAINSVNTSGDPMGLKALKWGLVLVSLGVAMVLIAIFGLTADNPVTYALLFIAGGAGLLVFYYLRNKLGDEHDAPSKGSD